ncbi:hypothetical protein RchiOBHm_Chr3g0461681 [Rosa chinensis]|uniref:Uncharacterized protein n=1 Tax=Rosa chinensis TaxID=74649 RepID=A0A2P6R8R6_ROSCH|nr:hypothetical protein RchiOBHm_Chr3g0461681 [Rosa chinensis]
MSGDLYSFASFVRTPLPYEVLNQMDLDGVSLLLYSCLSQLFASDLTLRFLWH